MIRFAPKLKTIITDFQVSEVIYLNPINTSESSDQVKNYSYYKLIKSNLTTLEAIDVISQFFDVDRRLIGHAGLKDEDGISEQHLSFPLLLPANKVSDFNTQFAQDKITLELILIGQRDEPLKVGDLLGNYFRIVIRNLHHQIAKQINQQKKHTCNFLNYYGPQRFGLPNHVKNTPSIGEFLLSKKYQEAVSQLSQQPNEIGKQAKKILTSQDSAENFIGQLNPNLLAFYQSSYYSSMWNNDLKHLLQNDDTLKVNQYVESGIDYLLLMKNQKLTTVPDFLPYIRVTPSNGTFQRLSLLRQTIVQLNLTSHKVFEDTYHKDSYACDVSFFLPSGCYATIALTQFINFLLCEHALNTSQQPSQEIDVSVYG